MAAEWRRAPPRDLAVFGIPEDTVSTLAEIIALIRPPKSRAKTWPATHALRLLWTCAQHGWLIPADAGPRLRALPHGDVPAFHGGAGAADRLAGDLIAAGPSRAAERNAVALALWCIEIGDPPSRGLAMAFGIAFGMIDSKTGEPTMRALGITLAPESPDAIRDAAVRDGEARAHFGRRATIRDQLAIVGGSKRAFCESRATPGYRNLERVVAISLAPPPEPAPCPPYAPEPPALPAPRTEGQILAQRHESARLLSIAIRPRVSV